MTNQKESTEQSKKLTDQLKKLSNQDLVTIFFNLNVNDDMATNRPELYITFAKQFMNRKINLADYIK